MSLPYSNPDTRGGIIELADFKAGSTPDSYPIEDKTREANLAVAAANAIALKAAGTWNYDDSNSEDYPIATTALVQGQREYPFVSDESGKLVLRIKRVFIKTQSLNGQNGVYQEIYPIDPETQHGTQGFTNGLDVQSVPYRYAKLGTGIFLDNIAGYDEPDGIKVYFDREGSYFTVNSTTQMPGFAGDYHEYIASKIALAYAKANRLDVKDDLQVEVLDFEKKIDAFYGGRERDARPVIRPFIKPFV